MTTYRLGSGPNISAPGVVRWAINGAAFPDDVPAVVRVIVGGWHIPEDIACQLVTKQVPYTVEDETVVFEALPKTAE
jgi:hypothetical protein